MESTKITIKISLLNKANFLAISGYIWKNKKLKPKDAIKTNMKINAGEIRVGMLLEYRNDLWQVLKNSTCKPGKGGAFAQVEMKSVNKKIPNLMRDLDPMKQLKRPH